MFNQETMSLEQKVGQLFICGFHSYTPDEQITTLIGKYQVGGVIYFRRNVQSAPQLAKLSGGLQTLAMEALSGLPLLIAIDQEGGMVSRLDHDGISRIPGNMSLGAADDPALTEAIAALSAKELNLLGINMNFAPCVDVNNNPLNPVIGVRSYSEDPMKVAVHGEAAVRGFQGSGIIATAKHFPGHGDTEVDSHMGLAVVGHDKQRLYDVELLPFKRMIQAGVKAIMTAHVVFPAFEPKGTPATLSRAVLTDLLREELEFEGVIVTDCLEMKAISDRYGVAEGAVMALEAGADLVLVSHTLEEQTAAIEAAVAAVKSGRLSETAIDRSLQRILALKSGLATVNTAVTAVPFAAPQHMKQSLKQGIEQGTQLNTEHGVPLLPSEQTVPLLEQAAGKSITLVKNEGNPPRLPLDTALSTLVVWPELRHRTEVDEAAEYRYTLADALQPYLPEIKLAAIGTRATDEEVQTVLREAEAYSQVVVVTYTSEGTLPEGQVRLVKGLMTQKQEKITVVSARNPYDIQAFPEVQAYLCAYENRPFALDAVAAVLVGRRQPGGRLPVTLSNQFPVGTGLTYL
ncbi:beta-N-acetylhexosaminidase [Paenibacillus physcomitrellae]|uniref:Beta-glucosidase n=1 Tax=Paenibacillus physcomitrellae TaxID=1619311 RepID=A0ABQ1FM70_9BACL|nr:beta-N-acetylhexosaminidase [Paenibacillus physcomitrellae]GGA22196.1 beta-glucosidase [Paenibacillus physcomitrellae]